MAAFGGANAVSKSYVSSVSFLDQREILNKLLNVTNEELSFLDVMELMGRSIETAVPQYHTFVNQELYGGAVTSASSSAYSGNQTTGTLTLAAATDAETVRAGDLVMIDSGVIAYVKSINSDYDELTITKVSDNLYSSAATELNGVKVVAFSNAAGEGSNSPVARRIKPVKQSNQVQIFKEKYVITDIQNASKIEFEFKGQPYYFLKGQHESLMRFRGDIAFAMMFGDASSALFSDASSALVDAEGNPIQTTKGLRQSIVDGGITQSTDTSGSVDNDDMEELTRTLNQKRAPREYMIFTGTSGEVAFDNYLNSLGNTDISSNARFSIDGRDIDLGVDKFRLYGRSYVKKYLPMLDHQQVVNFTGSAGFQHEAYFVPNDKIKAAGSGESLDRMRIRYMAGNGTDLKYREIMLGGLAPTPTDERSVLECHYESVQGLEVLGAEHFAKLDIQS